MADKAELRNMVLSFRVSELQLLLGLTSQSRCGRKTELMQRALAMVERGVTVPVQLKIRELYQRFTPRSAGYSSSHVGSSSSSSSLSRHHSSISASSLGSHHSASRAGSTGSGVASVHRGTGSGAVPAHRGTGSGAAPVHRGLSELLIQQQRSQIPTHPDVKYKHLPFYDVLGEIMKPTSMVPRSSARQQEARLSFCLNDQQVKEIAMSRPSQDTQTPAEKLDFAVQIQLRFCLLDTNSRQPDLFPSNISVKVNGMIAQLPNPIPTNKPGMEPKRPSRPVDITKICRLNASAANSLIITWNADDTKNHSVAVYLVKKLDSNVLLQRLKRAGLQKVEHTKSLVREKLSLDQDTDLATTSIRVSLLCPLGKMRMSIPCRASTCNHLQCFDGPTFLQMNEKKPTWICPVCDRPAEFSRLVIDGLFMEIIRGSVDSTEVELGRDGQWRVTKTDDSDDDSLCNSPPPFGATDTTTSITTGLGSASHASNTDTGRTDGVTSNGASGGGDCIDLTESDEEAAAAERRRVALSDRPAPLTTAPANHGSTPPLPSSARLQSTAASTATPPRSSVGSPSVHDLSPLNIPMPGTPPPLPSVTPPRPTMDLSPPPIPLPPVPPMAHQSYTPFTLSSKRSSHSSTSLSSSPALAHSGSQRTAAHNSSTSPYYGTGLPGANMGLGAPGYDGLLQQPDMMDFLSMIGSMSEYSVGSVGSGVPVAPGGVSPYPLSGGALDSFYQARATAAAAGDVAERRGGRRSPQSS